MSWLFKLIPFIKGLGGIKLYLIIASAALAVGGYSGWKLSNWKHSATFAAALERALDEQKKQLAKNKEIEIRYIEKEGKERIIYRDRIKKVIEYVEKNPDGANRECFADADGLQLYRDALTGSTDTSSPAR